mgnify:CR=1 FL=1
MRGILEKLADETPVSEAISTTQTVTTLPPRINLESSPVFSVAKPLASSVSSVAFAVGH